MEEQSGLRLGLFFAGALMAAVPVSVGIGFAVFLVRELWKEHQSRNE